MALLLEFSKTGKVVDYSDLSIESPLFDQDLTTEIQQLLGAAGYSIPADGVFGRTTRDALNQFKEDTFLGEPDKFGPSTATKLLEFKDKDLGQEFRFTYPPVEYDSRQLVVTIPEGHEQKSLNADAYQAAAKEFDLEPAAIRAVVAIEAAGSGFLLKEKTPARPKILFEAHHFYKNTKVAVSKVRPDLATRRWNPKLYKGGSAEWNRLLDAMQFDPEAALLSASWGWGQVMGSNYKVSGCNSVQQMVVEAHKGEFEQLRHMLNFVKNNGLIPAMKSKDWAKFARGYNGPAYKKNNYDQKLAAAYRRFS